MLDLERRELRNQIILIFYLMDEKTMKPRKNDMFKFMQKVNTNNGFIQQF